MNILNVQPQFGKGPPEGQSNFSSRPPGDLVTPKGGAGSLPFSHPYATRFESSGIFKTNEFNSGYAHLKEVCTQNGTLVVPEVY